MMTLVWGAIKGFSLKTWAYIALAFAVLAAFAKTYSAGRKSAQVDGLEDQLRNVGIRNEVENEVRRAGPDAVHDELQREWRRD